MVDLNEVYKNNSEKIDERVRELLQVEMLLDIKELAGELLSNYLKCPQGCELPKVEHRYLDKLRHSILKYESEYK